MKMKRFVQKVLRGGQGHNSAQTRFLKLDQKEIDLDSISSKKSFFWAYLLLTSVFSTYLRTCDDYPQFPHYQKVWKKISAAVKRKKQNQCNEILNSQRPIITLSVHQMRTFSLFVFTSPFSYTILSVQFARNARNLPKCYRQWMEQKERSAIDCLSPFTS